MSPNSKTKERRKRSHNVRKRKTPQPDTSHETAVSTSEYTKRQFQDGLNSLNEEAQGKEQEQENEKDEHSVNSNDVLSYSFTALKDVISTEKDTDSIMQNIHRDVKDMAQSNPYQEQPDLATHSGSEADWEDLGESDSNETSWSSVDSRIEEPLPPLDSSRRARENDDYWINMPRAGFSPSAVNVGTKKGWVDAVKRSTSSESEEEKRLADIRWKKRFARMKEMGLGDS